MLRTRLSFPACLGPAVAACAQALFSDSFSATPIETTHWTTSTLYADSSTATYNRERTGNNSQISAGSFASINSFWFPQSQSPETHAPPRRNVESGGG